MAHELEPTKETAVEFAQRGYERKEEGFEGLGPPPDGFVRVVIDYPVSHTPQIATRIDEDDLSDRLEAELADPYHRHLSFPPRYWTSVLDAETGKACEGTLKQMIMSKATVDTFRNWGGRW